MRERERGDRDLLADRVGGDGRARGRAGEDLHEQRLLDAGAAGRERHERGDRVDAEHEQHVAHRAADVERLEQEPERGEAKAPSRRTGPRTPRAGSGGGRTGSSGPGARGPRTPARAPRAARSRPARRPPSTVSTNSVKLRVRGEERRGRTRAATRSPAASGTTPCVNANARIGIAMHEVEDRLDGRCRRHRRIGRVRDRRLDRKSWITSPPRAGTTLLNPYAAM